MTLPQTNFSGRVVMIDRFCHVYVDVGRCYGDGMEIERSLVEHQF